MRIDDNLSSIGYIFASSIGYIFATTGLRINGNDYAIIMGILFIKTQ